MAYRVEIGQRADAQLADLDSVIGASVERKISWLAENASALLHRRLAGMPDELPASANCASVIGEFSIGFTIPSKSSASIAFNIVPKSIDSSKHAMF